MAASAAELALRARLAAYDGRAVTILGEAEAACRAMPGYVDALLGLCGEVAETVAAGASWLLRSAVQSGETLTEAQVTGLVAQLDHVQGWAAQLHLCQTIRELAIPAEAAAELADWLTPLLRHERPFLRAWSLDALAHLAKAHPAYGEAYAAALDRALEDDAASVSARARRLAKR